MIPEHPYYGRNAKGEFHDAFVINHGFLTRTNDILRHVFEVSGLTVAEWNALPEQERYDRVDAFVDKPPKEPS